MLDSQDLGQQRQHERRPLVVELIVTRGERRAAAAAGEPLADLPSTAAEPS